MHLLPFYFLSVLLFLINAEAKNYNIFGIGSSSIRYMFNKHSSWEVNETTRAIELPDQTTHYIKCYLQTLSGKTIYGLNKINIGTLVYPHLIDSLDAILLNFGSVDVIWHIQKQADKQHKSIAQVIEDLIIPYIDNVLNIRRTFPHFTKPIILMATTPPTSPARMTVSETFNSSLKYHALQNNLVFFDPYAPCIKENGLLKDEYDEHDGIHFSAANNQILVDSLHSLLENLQ